MTRFLTMPILYGLLAALIAAGAFATVQTLRLSSERTAHADTRTAHAKELREIANLTRAASDEARRRERAHSTALADARATTTKEFTDALALKDRTAADLRAGNQRLRDEWQGCPATTAAVPRDAGTRPPADAGADLRARGAASLVAAGAEADTWVRGLQRELSAAFALCGPVRVTQ